MATKKKIDDSILLVAEEENAPRPRLHKLIIQNFRSIGATKVEIKLDATLGVRINTRRR